MKKKIIIIALSSLFLIIAGLLFFYSPILPRNKQPLIEKTKTMKVGYLPVLANLPLFVALKNNYFEKYNLQVEAIEAQSPNHIIEGIIAGKLDGAGILAYPLLFAAEEKYPGELKLFASSDETTENFVSAILVKEGSEIYTMEDLKNKKIGVYTGLVQVLFLKGIIAGAGMDPENDIEIIQIAPRLQLQGLKTGYYDALSTVEPFPTIAAHKKIGRVLIENPRVKNIQNPFPSVATPISAKFIENHSDTARAYLQAYRDAINFIRSNPEQSKLYLTEYTPIDKDIAKNVRLFKFNQFGEEDRNNIQKYADWMVEKKLLKEKIDVYSMFGDIELIQ